MLHSMEQHQHGQLARWGIHGVPSGVNHAAGLSQRVTQGPAPPGPAALWPGRDSGGSPALGRRHLTSRRPEPGGGQGAPGPGLVQVAGFQRLDGLLRQIQGPQDQNPAVLPGSSWAARPCSRRTVLGKQNLILPLGLFNTWSIQSICRTLP